MVNQNILFGLGSLSGASLRLSFKTNQELADFLLKQQEPDLVNHQAKPQFSRAETVQAYRNIDPIDPLDVEHTEIEVPGAPAKSELLQSQKLVPDPITTFDDVKLIDLASISTAPDLFQNREAEYSQESVSRIIAAVEDGSFNWFNFDPILLWQRPTGQLVVLSGHSRFEAFKQLSRMNLMVAGRAFTAIPAKFANVSEEEAIKIARTSNNLSTRETEMERAMYYRNLAANGATKKEIDTEAGHYEGKNKNLILNLAALNPNGNAWLSLIAFGSASEGQNLATIRTIAEWVGNAKRRLDFTNSEENEVFEWLSATYQNPIYKLTEFLDRLSLAITKRNMVDPDGPLNLLNRTSKSNAMQEYEAEMQEARRQIKMATAKADDLRKRAIAEGFSKTKIDAILEETEGIIRFWQRKIIELTDRKADVRQGENMQLALFGIPGMSSASILFGVG